MPCIPFYLHLIKPFPQRQTMCSKCSAFSFVILSSSSQRSLLTRYYCFFLLVISSLDGLTHLLNGEFQRLKKRFFLPDNCFLFSSSINPERMGFSLQPVNQTEVANHHSEFFLLSVLLQTMFQLKTSLAVF